MIDTIENGSKVVLFGAGKNGIKVLGRLIEKGIEPSYFIDNNRTITKIGVEIKQTGGEGKQYDVHSPDILLAEDKTKLRIIITPSGLLYKEINAQLVNMGFKDCIGQVQLMCPRIAGHMNIHADKVVFCCRQGAERGKRPEFPILDTPEETVDNFLLSRKEIIKELANGGSNTGLSAPCLDCHELTKLNIHNHGFS